MTLDEAIEGLDKRKNIDLITQVLPDVRDLELGIEALEKVKYLREHDPVFEGLQLYGEI